LIADALQPPRYSPMRQTVSVLAGYAGTDRWLMTGGLAAVGVCYFVTTAGLRDIPIAARIVLLVTGIAAVGVAACPQPVHGSTVAHMFWTGVGELALAALPAIIGLHRLDHRLLNARESAVVAGLFGANDSPRRCRRAGRWSWHSHCGTRPGCPTRYSSPP
jgi:fumarate reductase subunit D